MSSNKLLSISAIFSLLLATCAREIVFPSINAYQSSLRVDGSLDDVDITTGSQFSGLTTFAHLPYVNCFVATNDAQKYDIAFLGAPFDTVSTISKLFVLAVFRHPSVIFHSVFYAGRICSSRGPSGQSQSKAIPPQGRTSLLIFVRYIWR